MKKSTIIIIAIAALLGVLFFVSTCYRSGGAKTDLPPGVHQVEVKEVLQTNNYTYLNVEEDKESYWMAVVSAEYKPGDMLYYSKAMKMTDFKSRELDRTFPSILFVDDASPELPTGEATKPPQRTMGKPALQKMDGIKLTPAAGGITIEELYKNIGNYANKTVMIKGVVAKYNSEIMQKNWIHIQDGTEFGGKFDLTVTTQDTISVGKEVTFKGTIYLNKDFGSGYSYDVIMEEAHITEVR
jgi:hypothetical protein